uniref:Uncharacterized protein n=1 Tax=Phasianus colchicus TaxID=9054 RepID=A0A669PLT0_PHACC
TGPGDDLFLNKLRHAEGFPLAGGLPKGPVNRSGGTKSGEKQDKQAYLLWKDCLWQTIKPSYKLVMCTFVLEKLKCQSVYSMAILLELWAKRLDGISVQVT